MVTAVQNYLSAACTGPVSPGGMKYLKSGDLETGAVSGGGCAGIFHAISLQEGLKHSV